MLKMIGAILISFVVILVGWAAYEHQTGMEDQQARQTRQQWVKDYHQKCDLDPSKYEHDKAWEDHQAACEQMKQIIEQ